MKWKLAASIVTGSLILAGCGGGSSSSSDNKSDPHALAEENFANIAHAMVEDSLIAATTLQTKINAFIAEPTEANLAEAKIAYKALRSPYQQFEITRFDAENGHVSLGASDAGVASVDDWEGQVNAWPLDEALIDYVTPAYNGEYPVEGNNALNIINPGNSETLSIDVTSTEALAGLNELGGSEANVATGIHAVEFLLWGQDLTTGAGNYGAGTRPASDYDTSGGCTSGANNAQENSVCERRGNYLKTVTQLLVDDLTAMEKEWDATTEGNTLRTDFLSRGDGLERMVDSMGDMAIGELASERMKVAVLTNSTEDEHDCFSDLTHTAIFGNAQGVVNAYRGSYTRIDGTVVSGASISDLVKAVDADADTEIQGLMTTVLKEMQDIVDAAEATENPKTFDMIVGSEADKPIVMEAVAALEALNTPLSTTIPATLSVTAAGIDEGTCGIGATEEGACDTEE